MAVGVALITKAPSIALLPASAWVVLVASVKLLGKRRVGAAALAAACALAAFLLPVGAWQLTVRALARPAYQQATGVAAGGLNVKEFLSYVWQYYLPRLPFQTPIGFDSGYVRWVTVDFPLWVYRVFAAVTAAVGLAALVRVGTLLWRQRRSPRLRSVGLPVAVFLGLAASVLHLAEYRVKGPTNQGRYLFPLAGLGACAVALATTLVPRRARGGPSASSLPASSATNSSAWGSSPCTTTRSAAVTAAVSAFAIVALLVLGATTKSRQVQTLGVAGVSPVADLKRGQQVCEQPVALVGDIDAVTFSPGTPGAASACGRRDAALPARWARSRERHTSRGLRTPLGRRPCT